MKTVLRLLAAGILLGMISGCDSETSTVASRVDQGEPVATEEREDLSIATETLDSTEAVSTEKVLNDEDSSSDDESIYNAEIAAAESGSEDSYTTTGGGIVSPYDIKTIDAGWYMRTVVSAVAASGKIFQHDSAGVFGEYDQSSDARDSHDIERYGDATLQVVFVNEALGDNEYFSDYRRYDGSNKKQVWDFVVKNETGDDLSDAALKIEVEAVHDILRKENSATFTDVVSTAQKRRDNLILVDVDNEKTYTYSELKEITLNMDGKHVRSFRWVLNGSVENDDLKPFSNIKPVNFTDKTIQQSESFGINVSKFGLPPK